MSLNRILMTYENRCSSLMNQNLKLNTANHDITILKYLFLMYFIDIFLIFYGKWMEMLIITYAFQILSHMHFINANTSQ